MGKPEEEPPRGGLGRRAAIGVFQLLADQPALFQALKYGGVGFINAAVTIIVMVVCERIGFQYLVYTALGYFAGFLNSYIINGLFTFRVGRLSIARFAQFAALNLSLLLGVELLEYWLIDRVGIRELFGVAIGMATYTAVGFVLNRSLIFRK